MAETPDISPRICQIERRNVVFVTYYNGYTEKRPVNIHVSVKHFSVLTAERFAETTMIQLFSLVRIDAVHHQSDSILHQVSSFWKHPAYQLVIDFNRTFLVRASGIAIINLSAWGVLPGAILNCLWIRKLTAIIRQDEME